MNPEDLVAAATAADAALLDSLRDLTDDTARAPSRLPDWSRGHVITHLARHAEAHVRLLGGESTTQYPGGVEGRAADIEAGADRPAHDLVADLEHWAGLLPKTWAAVDDWTATVTFLLGEGPKWRSPATRWREVEVHRVDLDLGYEPGSWPQEFVVGYLPDAFESLAGRLGEGVRVHAVVDGRALVAGAGDEIEVDGPDWALLAWIYGRDFPHDILQARRAGETVALPEIGGWA